MAPARPTATAALLGALSARATLGDDSDVGGVLIAPALLLLERAFGVPLTTARRERERRRLRRSR